jgi:hypothetical protein
MFRIISTIILVALTMALFISGCGSSNTGGVEQFTTVEAFATVDSTKNPLLSDLAKWSAQTGICTDVTNTSTIQNDIINFTVKSNITIKNGTASPLMLQKATIVFSPADTLTPQLPLLYSTQYFDLQGYSVPAGGSLPVPVEIAKHTFKEYLYPSIVCNTNSIYSYNVKVIFSAIETNTGKQGEITAGMTVRFSDFTD